MKAISTDSLKPYFAACIVQALPIAAWAARPALFGDMASAQFFHLLAWSNLASFAGGVIIGALRVGKPTQLLKCLVPALAVGALGALFQSSDRSEIAIYMLGIFILSQAPGAILGGAIGAFGARRRSLPSQTPRTNRN